jgi:hypothetical protein
VADKRKEQERLVVPIEWHFPEGIVTRYANNMVVQFGDHDCYLSFFEIPVPVLLGTPGEQLEQAKKLKHVRAECIARIVLPISKMPEIVEALRSTLAANIAKVKSITKTSGE